MPALTWDDTGERFYQYGVDRGVIFPAVNTPNVGIPWNGLTSVTRDPEFETEPVYFAGRKIHDAVVSHTDSWTIRAMTYPDELVQFQGYDTRAAGVSVDGSSRVKRFHLTWRTRVGNDLNGDLGHKIHILYNCVAVPAAQEFSTLSDSPTLVEFEWALQPTPEFVDDPAIGHAGYLKIDTTKAAPVVADFIQDTLYGLGNGNNLLYDPNTLWYLIKVGSGLA